MVMRALRQNIMRTWIQTITETKRQTIMKIGKQVVPWTQRRIPGYFKDLETHMNTQ